MSRYTKVTHILFYKSFPLSSIDFKNTTEFYGQTSFITHFTFFLVNLLKACFGSAQIF